MTAPTLPLSFPKISLYENEELVSPERLTVVPYLKSRPMGSSIAFPPSISDKMAQGSDATVVLDGIGNFALFPVSADMLNDLERQLARAIVGLKGWKHTTIVLPAASYIKVDAQTLAAYLTDMSREHYSLKTKSKIEKAESSSDSLALANREYVFGADEKEGLAQAIKAGVAMGKARAFMRTLMDMPPNIATPTSIPKMLRVFVDCLTPEYPGLANLRIRTSGESESHVAGMSTFLAVAKGSQEPAQFLEVSHRIELDDKLCVSDVNFVGKGITFDAGGISLKPSNNMHHMKGDMGGAASVLAAILYASMMDMQLKLRGFMPLCENLPDGNAVKPGDVVHAYNGKTIEIIDTDAEGRLVLADALAYSSEFATTCTFDMATLTGACKVALGTVHAGLFTDSDELAAEVMAAGKAGKDKAWRLPMGEEYESMLKSNVADYSNLSRASGGGSINGAVFLKQFVKQQDRWVHLDIANVSGDSKATGRPLALLVKFLDERNRKASA